LRCRVLDRPERVPGQPWWGPGSRRAPAPSAGESAQGQQGAGHRLYGGVGLPLVCSCVAAVGRENSVPQPRATVDAAAGRIVGSSMGLLERQLEEARGDMNAGPFAGVDQRVSRGRLQRQVGSDELPRWQTAWDADVEAIDRDREQGHGRDM
jgi:hypothetical protein